MLRNVLQEMVLKTNKYSYQDMAYSWFSFLHRPQDAGHGLLAVVSISILLLPCIAILITAQF